MLTKNVFKTEVTQSWTWPEENQPSSGTEGQQVSLCELMGSGTGILQKARPGGRKKTRSRDKKEERQGKKRNNK